MKRLKLTLVGRLYAQRQEIRAFQAAYGRLQAAHHQAVEDLEIERQRAADAFFAATAECPMCEELERERDSAMHEAEGLRAQVTKLAGTVEYLERDLRLT